jgi:acyl-CoA thioesterase
MDEWVLYEMESPRTISNRGYAIGRFFTIDGVLVLSCSQEGVVRVSPEISLPNGKL